MKFACLTLALITSLSAVSTGQIYTVAPTQQPQFFGLPINLFPSLPPQDLPLDYFPVKITSGAEIEQVSYPIAISLLEGMGGEQSNMESLFFYAALAISWTNGQVTTLYGKQFLITYRLGLDQVEMSNPKRESLTGVPLELTLVAVDSIKTLSPALGMNKERFIRLLSTKLPKPTAPPMPKLDEAPKEDTKPLKIKEPLVPKAGLIPAPIPKPSK
jgi:hypothetical protein